MLVEVEEPNGIIYDLDEESFEDVASSVFATERAIADQQLRVKVKNDKNLAASSGDGLLFALQDTPAPQGKAPASKPDSAKISKAAPSAQVIAGKKGKRKIKKKVQRQADAVTYCRVFGHEKSSYSTDNTDTTDRQYRQYRQYEQYRQYRQYRQDRQ